MEDYMQMFFFFIFGLFIAAGMGIVGHTYGGFMEAVFFFVTIFLYLFCFLKVIQNYEKKRANKIKKAG